MGIEPGAPDTDTPDATAAAPDPEALAALSRQISLDMRPAQRSPGYGWLLLLALSAVVAVCAFAVISLSRGIGGGPSSQIGRVGQAYKQTEQALQQDQSSAPQVGGGSTGPGVVPTTQATKPQINGQSLP